MKYYKRNKKPIQATHTNTFISAEFTLKNDNLNGLNYYTNIEDTSKHREQGSDRGAPSDNALSDDCHTRQRERLLGLGDQLTVTGNG